MPASPTCDVRGDPAFFPGVAYGSHRTELHSPGHRLRHRTAGPMSLRNHLPCHRPGHVCADPIQELPYRRLPSHNANSDVRSLNRVSQLDVPDSRLRIRWCPTFLKPRVLDESCTISTCSS